MSRPTLIASLLIALGLLPCLGACGGGGDNPPAMETGEFFDSPVSGLNYLSGSLSGTTDASGSFVFPPGTGVELSVGALVIGTATSALRISTVDLVSGATDETNPTVTNIASFLQTIDDDANPANGITIIPAVAALGTVGAIDFTLSIDGFQSNAAVANLVQQMTALTAAGERTLVTATTAQAHLRNTLLALLAGLYDGDFSGDDSGTWQGYIGSDGSLTGWGISQSDGFFGFVGTVASSGAAVFGNVSTGASFSGSAGDGVLNGTWQNTLEGFSGTFSGNQTQPALAFVPPANISAVQGTYTGTYELGNENGSFTIVIASNGQVSLTLGIGQASAAISATDGATDVRITGLTDGGTQVDGNADMNGNVAGSLTNTNDGTTGSFSGTRQ